MMMNFVSHGTQDMYPTFLERHWGFSPRERILITALSMVGAIIGGGGFGYFFFCLGGRRPMIFSLVLGVVGMPPWGVAPSLAVFVFGAFLFPFIVERERG